MRLNIWPFNRTERRSAYATISQLFGWGDGTSRAWSYQQLSKDYRDCAVVRASLDMIGQGLCALRYPIAIDGEILTEERTMPAHLLPLAAMLRRPNDNQAFAEFIAKWSIHLHCAGQTYTQGVNIGAQVLGDITRARTGAELYLLRPDCIKALHKDRRIERYEYREPGTGALKVFKPDEVVTHRFPHPDDDFAGLSPLAAVRNEVDSLIEASKWQATTFKNLAIPAGVISMDNWNQLDQPERDRIRAAFPDQYAGAKNQGKTLFLGAKATYQSLASTPKELDWINSDAAQMRKVASALRVPSILVGDPAQSTYANYGEARAAFFEQTVIPLANQWTGEINHRFIALYGDNVSIAVDYSHIDALRENENDKYARLTHADWLTDNEKRAKCGYDAVQGGDELTKPMPPMLAPPDEEDEDEPPKGKEGRSAIPFPVASTRRAKSAGAR